MPNFFVAAIETLSLAGCEKTRFSFNTACHVMRLINTVAARRRLKQAVQQGRSKRRGETRTRCGSWRL
jgi:hypothetical protein